MTGVRDRDRARTPPSDIGTSITDTPTLVPRPTIPDSGGGGGGGGGGVRLPREEEKAQKSRRRRTRGVKVRGGRLSTILDRGLDRLRPKVG